MLQWRKMRIRIRVRSESDTDTPVYKEVVGRGVGKIGVHKQGHSSNWNVTHAPSGLCVTTLPTQKECVMLVEELSRRVFGFTSMSYERISNRESDIIQAMDDWVCKERGGWKT